MHNSNLMQEIDCQKHLVHNGGGLRLIIPANKLQTLVKVSTVQKLTHDIEILIIFKHLKNLNEVLVIHSLQYVELCQKHLRYLFITHFGLGYHLNRILFPCLQLDGLVDPAISSLAQNLADSIVRFDVVNEFEVLEVLDVWRGRNPLL